MRGRRLKITILLRLVLGAAGRAGVALAVPPVGQRRLQGLIPVLVLLTALSGCAARPGPEVLNPIAARAGGADDLTLLAVTDRARAVPGAPDFGSARGGVSYEAFTMRKAGADRAAGSGDASKEFVTVGRRALDRAGFLRTVAQMKKADGTVVVFVHGYNTSYQEAVFLLAELTADVTGEGAVPVLFSWPSEGDFRGYVADRDSTTYARDDLVELLKALAALPSRDRTVVFGHSMGALLVVEALRQLRLEGRGDVIDRLEVGLGSPDIDVDVFMRQIKVIGPLDPPLLVLVSKDDRALAISSRIAGGKPRLGLVPAENPQVQKIARASGVQFIDVTTLPSSDVMNHDRFVTFAAHYSAARRQGGSAGGLRQAGLFLLDTAGNILVAPFQGAAQILGGAP